MSSRVARKSSRSPVWRVLGTIAWVPFALLGLAVKGALAPGQRSNGVTAVIWGVVFGLYLWWGSHQIGLGQTRAILLGVIAGAASALFVYLRGAGLNRPPADRPGASARRFAARRRLPKSD
jgi:hypothetical protein